MAAVRPVTNELSGGCAPGMSPGWVQSILSTDWSWSGQPGGIYQLFQAMEDKDAHLFATLQTRKNALLACPWKVVAAADTPEAMAAAANVRENLAALPHLNKALFHLLDAISKGYALSEIIWEIDAKTGRVKVADIRARSQADFAFDVKDQLYRVSDHGRLSAFGHARPATLSPGHSPLRQDALIPRPGEAMLDARHAVALPPRKFLHFAFQGNACTPYGSALCIKAYWYYWLKKNTLQHWALFNEKFGSPTAVARYSSATTEEDLQKLQETVASLPRDSGVLLPENVGLEFLEARRSSGANTYRELADWCNDEISKIVLGQTLTTGEGRRSGSLALGQVHESVRRDYLASDAAMLGQVLSSQLCRWLTDFNFGEHVPAPQIVFDVDPPERFETELRIDRELVKIGVPLSASYFYDRYRRPVPRDDERTLRFDDANLYQYHLLHGVLTVNEVRSTLGLPAVAWGNHPTGQALDHGRYERATTLQMTREDDERDHADNDSDEEREDRERSR